MGAELLRSPVGADLLWMRRGYRDLQHRLEDLQLLNHFPAEGAIVDKGKLTTRLRTLDASLGEGDLRLDAFYPETYRLYREDDRAAFFAQLPATPTKQEPWILKPTGLSKGRGVFVAWRFDPLRRVFADPRIDDPAYAGRIPRYIAQRYLKDVLLLDQRKSEIRIYWLIASLEPLRVLMYREGTTRLTSQPFKLDDFENPLIHITNAFQQKNHPDFDPAVELKWEFDRLERHLVEERGLAAPGHLERELRPRLRACLAFVARAARERLASPPTQGHYFGLYGADFILDGRLRPWLTEVQRGPGLSHDDPVKARLIPPMLAEALRIVLEIQAQRRAGEPPGPLASVRNFEWVVDEAAAS